MSGLKIIGGLFLLYQVAGQAATALFSQIKYSFLPIQRGDFRVAIEGVKVVGKLRVKMKVFNKSQVTLTASQLRATLTQQNQILGHIITQNAVQLPAGQEKVLSFDVTIPAAEALERIQEVLNSGLTSAISPIQVKGSLVFSNGKSLTINKQIQFFSVQ